MTLQDIFLPWASLAKSRKSADDWKTHAGRMNVAFGEAIRQRDSNRAEIVSEQSGANYLEGLLNDTRAVRDDYAKRLARVERDADPMRKADAGSWVPGLRDAHNKSAEAAMGTYKDFVAELHAPKPTLAKTTGKGKTA